MTDELVNVGYELDKAIGKHLSMTSFHEGLAVIQEEVFELQLEVYKKHPSPAKLREEALQVAAMAVRFLIDLLPNAEPESRQPPDPDRILVELGKPWPSPAPHFPTGD